MAFLFNAPPPVFEDETGVVDTKTNFTPMSATNNILISPSAVFGIGQAMNTPAELSASLKFIGQQTPQVFQVTPLQPLGSGVHPIPAMPLNSFPGTMNEGSMAQLSDVTATPPSGDSDGSSFDTESDYSSPEETVRKSTRKALKAKATIDNKLNRSKKTERCSSHPQQLKLANDRFHRTLPQRPN